MCHRRLDLIRYRLLTLRSRVKWSWVESVLCGETVDLEGRSVDPGVGAAPGVIFESSRMDNHDVWKLRRYRADVGIQQPQVCLQRVAFGVRYVGLAERKLDAEGKVGESYVAAVARIGGIPPRKGVVVVGNDNRWGSAPEWRPGLGNRSRSEHPRDPIAAVEARRRRQDGSQ